MIQLIHPPLLINVAHPRLHAFTPCPGKNWVIQYRYFRLRWPGKARVNMNPRYLHCTCTSCHDHLNILLWMVMINTKHLLMIKCTIGGIGGMFWFKTQQEQKKNIQLGQPSVIPPRLVLEVGGTSTLQAAMPVKLKSPPLQASKWGGGLQLSRHNCLQGWSPPHFKHKSGGDHAGLT